MENDDLQWNFDNLDLDHELSNDRLQWNFDVLDTNQSQREDSWNFDGLDLENADNSSSNNSDPSVANEPQAKKIRLGDSQSAGEIEPLETTQNDIFNQENQNSENFDEDYVAPNESYDSENSDEEEIRPGTSEMNSSNALYSNKNFKVEVKRAKFKKNTRFNFSDMQYHVKFESKPSQNNVLLKDALEGLINTVHSVLQDLRSKIRGTKDRNLYLVSIDLM